MNSMIPSVYEMDVITTAVRSACKSTLFKGKTEDAGIAIALFARELGLPIMQCLLGGLNIINGTAELSARMLNNLIRQKGHTIQCVKCDDTVCVLKGTRADTGEECEVSFTLQEAHKANLVKAGGAWDKWTQDMLYARASSRLGRRLFPDVVGNSYVEGEVSKATPSPESFEQAVIEVPRLTEEQCAQIEELLKDNEALKVSILKKANKECIAHIEQKRFENLVKYITNELQKGAA